VAIGVDKSAEMLAIALKNLKNEDVKNALLFRATATALPFYDASFRHVLFIAALHVIKGKTNRITALAEVRRVLVRDGTALISVWSKWQDRYRPTFFKRMTSASARGDELGDICIPWSRDGLHIKRFYHLYGVREFLTDIVSARFSVERMWPAQKHSRLHPDNYFAVVKK
jgi:ubiquinone/menaquinone biosynthesis C-methylase UbiE